MVQKFSTKREKHTKDDEKRRESLKNKLKQNQTKKSLIKNALSGEFPGKAKKIVFDEESLDGDDFHRENVGNSDMSNSRRNSGEKKFLFDESDNDEGENYEIKIKSQFEGKKGQKLLNLQSNYNFDDRFKLDERFQDDGDDVSDVDGDFQEIVDAEKNVNAGPSELEKEKLTQLKVLEDVLGHSIQSQKWDKKPKKSFVEMVRFDASNEDHRRKDTTNEIETEEPVKKKKRHLDKEERKKKREARKEEMLKQESAAATVSNEKFYEVTDDLKAALKNRKKDEEGGAGFSLLAAFSKREADDEEIVEEHEEIEDRCDEVEEEVEHSKHEVNEKEEVEVMKAQGITNEKFFFSKDDPRFEEALNFINMKGSEEARMSMESYDEKRKSIREVLRLRWQKHRQRNNPFKKKIGGSAKKMAPFNKNKKPFGKPFGKRRH